MQWSSSNRINPKPKGNPTFYHEGKNKYHRDAAAAAHTAKP